MKLDAKRSVQHKMCIVTDCNILAASYEKHFTHDVITVIYETLEL